MVVNVPFTGQGGSKPRPAVVMSTDSFHKTLPDLIVCPVSSQPRRYAHPGVGDHPLDHWKAVGLRHSSTVRVSNIVAIERKLIKRVLGSLHADDLARVKEGLRACFGL